MDELTEGLKKWTIGDLSRKVNKGSSIVGNGGNSNEKQLPQHAHTRRCCRLPAILQRGITLVPHATAIYFSSLKESSVKIDWL